MLACILYSAIAVPIRVLPRGGARLVWLAEVCMTLAFLVDICFTFRTVFFDARAALGDVAT